MRLERQEAHLFHLVDEYEHVYRIIRSEPSKRCSRMRSYPEGLVSRGDDRYTASRATVRNRTTHIMRISSIFSTLLSCSSPHILFHVLSLLRVVRDCAPEFRTVNESGLVDSPLSVLAPRLSFYLALPVFATLWHAHMVLRSPESSKS